MNLNQRNEVMTDSKLIQAAQEDLFLTWMYNFKTEISLEKDDNKK